MNKNHTVLLSQTFIIFSTGNSIEGKKGEESNKLNHLCDLDDILYQLAVSE